MPGTEAPSTALARGWLFWRRSIQARIVVTTVLLSAVVVSVVGWVLLREIQAALVADRVEEVLAEARNETADAEERLAAVPGTDYETAQQLAVLVKPIIERGESRGYGVVLTGPVGSGPADPAEGGTHSSPGLDTRSIPDDLVRTIQRDGVASWTFGRVRYLPGADRPDVAGVIVGERFQLPADRDLYTVYYVFPLDREQKTMSLLVRALTAAGVALLLLLALLTWFVSHHVVTPIRMARRVAERLAAGLLEERMQVHGEDDLARLGTSFNQMAANLQRQIRQLEELSRVQRRFTSDVSHELRTPLTTVRMAGDLLYDARSGFDPATARAAELLQRELDRFESLLGELLEISRFDAGAAVLEIEDVNLVDLVHRVVESMAPLAASRETEVVVAAGDTPVLAECDPRRVERIVRNLVSNPIDHAERRGVVVHLAADDHSAAIAVRDYGVGLATGEAALVFNRFWRADPARARTSGGTGLGLSIALEDTHLHGGWLQAWGRPQQGSQFRLTLPRRADQVLRRSPLPLVPLDAGRPAASTGEAS